MCERSERKNVSVNFLKGRSYFEIISKLLNKFLTQHRLINKIFKNRKLKKKIRQTKGFQEEPNQVIGLARIL
jgi:hypothetical protein